MSFVLTALKIFQVVFAMGLIIAVMLHSAKGEGLGAIGGQAKIFGSQKGVEAGLNRLTSGLAILWGASSLLLALFTYHKLW
ncbi:MAG: preprotein translocase, SecG subunit [Cyanobacteria bacterium RYN_339]|nr:preprotein translocase, SecG subunit [Cyanobacteria bacterium RYN_339]